MPLTKVEGPSVNTITTTALTATDLSVNTASTSTLTSQAFLSTFVAGETVAVNDAVYVEPTLTQGTSGRVYKLDADVLMKSTQAFFAGFVTAAASAGANVTVQTAGVVAGFSGLTTGAMYYASATAGAITATKPLHPLPVGFAISTTQIFINTRKHEQEEKNVSAVYGYAMGGYTASADVVTTDRITFSTSVTAAYTTGNMATARDSAAPVSDGTVYGYNLGGYTGAAGASSERITFSTGVSVASTISNLSQARFGQAGVSDGAIYGYALGGDTAGGANDLVTTADRLSFSTSITAASTASNLSQARKYAAGVSDGTTYGYALGGIKAGGAGSVVTTADRLTFSSSVTAASTVSNLSNGRQGATGISDNATYGYAAGGYSNVYLTTTDRLTFSTSATAASTVSNLSQARQVAAGASDGVLYGYAMGGNSNSGAFVTTTDRLTFSTSATAASTASNLSQARGYAAGLSDGAV